MLAAEGRIRSHVRETPLELSPYLSAEAEAEVYLKLESHQITGSFKLRGAMNKCLSLSKGDRSRPVVTASSGNHAGAVAYALKELGGTGIIYLPSTVSPAKVEALAPYGVELRFVGSDSVEGELEAKRVSREEGLLYISPYSDPQVIGGQGTIAVEIERQLERFDAVFVPVGGGGLISGIAGYFKARSPSVRIVGCQPQASRVMYESLAVGRILDLPSERTLADGTAGGVDPDAITFPICQRDVDEMVLVSEDEIARAMRLAIEKHCMLIEGAAALSIASFLQKRSAYRGQTVVLVVSGKKVSLDILKTLL
ncbi:MAG TPA: threonine/serine dehydratase [Candidatus Methylomirabilis sp.]|nr:threonine/serine dehydratase [Candidatus Methylomirabilis sp.]